MFVDLTVSENPQKLAEPYAVETLDCHILGTAEQGYQVHTGYWPRSSIKSIVLMAPSTGWLVAVRDVLVNHDLA